VPKERLYCGKIQRIRRWFLGMKGVGVEVVSLRVAVIILFG
jgi:hypothetical protein